MALLTGAASAASAQSNIALDGSLPHGRTDVLTGPGTGPDYTIGEELGWRAGSNLFHSFLDFDLATGDSATFTADAALPALDNVLARVTGGDPSNIDGVLRSEIPGADFFFLNPAGVLFGGEASIDVPASFHVSTAHALHYEGVEAPLDLLSRGAPLLRAEPPEAFGFLEAGPRAEVVFSNAFGGFDLREYAVVEGGTLGAVGGDVRVQERVRLRATGGRIQLAAVGDAEARVPLDLAGHSDPDLSGEVSATGRSELLAVTANRGNPQGAVVIRGGRFALDEGSVVRAGDVAGPGGPSIDVEVSERIDVAGADTRMRAESPGSRDSGGLRLAAPDVRVADGALVRTRVDGDRRGGDLAIDAERVEIADGAIVGTLNNRSGSAGAVRITATERLDVRSGAEIQSLASSDGGGGDLVVRAGTLEIVDARIGSESGTAGSAGSIDVEAETVELRGGLAGVTTSSRSAVATAGGGDIRVTSAGALRVADGAVVSATTELADAGGSVVLRAAEVSIAGGGVDAGGSPTPSSVQTVTLGTGRAGDVRVEADSLRIGASSGSPAAASDRAGLLQSFVAPGASGAGGRIEVAAQQVVLESGGQVSTLSRGEGSAGPISIDATGAVRLVGDTVIDGVPTPSGIFTRSDGDADANSLSLSAGSLELRDGGLVSSRAAGAGDSGDLVISAAGTVIVAGTGINSSALSARAVDGAGGDVVIEATALEVRDGGSIDVSSSGAGPGGRIDVTADRVVVAGTSPLGPAELAAEADGAGDGQGIRVSAGEVRVENGGQISARSRGLGGNPGDVGIEADRLHLHGGRLSVLNPGGDAGNVDLDVDTLVARGSSITAEADGFGGTVAIRADRLVQLTDSEIVAESRGGRNASELAGGNIRIGSSPAVVLSGSTVTANGFGNADGGNITIAADPLLVSGDSAITASSELGVAGEIAILSPNTEVTGELAALTDAFLDASALLVESCLARDEVSGSFAVRTSGAPAPSPEAPLAPEDGALCEDPSAGPSR